MAVVWDTDAKGTWLCATHSLEGMEGIAKHRAEELKGHIQILRAGCAWSGNRNPGARFKDSKVPEMRRVGKTPAESFTHSPPERSGNTACAQSSGLVTMPSASERVDYKTQVAFLTSKHSWLQSIPSRGASGGIHPGNSAIGNALFGRP